MVTSCKLWYTIVKDMPSETAVTLGYSVVLSFFVLLVSSIKVFHMNHKGVIHGSVSSDASVASVYREP